MKPVKMKKYEIVRQIFRSEFKVHLGFRPRTFYNYMRMIKAEVETKEDKAEEGGRKRNCDEFDATA